MIYFWATGCPEAHGCNDTRLLFMKKEVKFKAWVNDCQRVWRGYCPALVPKEFGTEKIHSNLYDGISVRVLEEDKDEISEVYIDNTQLTTDILVQNYLQTRIENYLKTIPSTFPLEGICPYCHSPLDNAKSGKHLDVEGFEDTEFFADNGGGLGDLGILESCPYCNYWTWHYFEFADLGRWSLTAYGFTAMLGKLREFDSTLPEGCTHELVSQIRQNPKRWHLLEPKALERLVADIFRANYDYAEVTHVGKPDDGGIDVIYIDSSNSQWLIQVKRRENALSTESVSTIRNLLGTMLLENSTHGIVVSTADHFSYCAYDAVSRAAELGMTLKLIDRHALDHMLTGLQVDPPWVKPIREKFSEFTDKLMNKIPCKNYRQLKLL